MILLLNILMRCSYCEQLIPAEYGKWTPELDNICDGCYKGIV
jgi:hypothetical protein